MEAWQIILGIIGFIIATLLIPALMYIWSQNKKEMEKLEGLIMSHLEGSDKYRGEVSKNLHSLRTDFDKKVNSVEVELRITKTNYIERFSDLKEQINNKFTATNKYISDLALDVKEIVTIMKNKNE